ncbi:MAG: metal-dependent transcriptional regulator [Melioribacteraceae bacterium]|nr:metal-dependent transcriptional regulator [Melioribacteraceae bacterium]
MEPLITLIVGIGILVVIILIAAPEKGLWSRWAKQKTQREKVLVEDALKHLYDCEYNNIDCTLNSISGNLSISGDQASKLISKLEELGLIVRKNGKIILTNEGRLYALRIIRTHRLWEKYLADNTSVNETDWHNLAELKEHELSNDEVNRLAARLGNPLQDPHGDPIPSESGEIPKVKYFDLSQLSVGKFGRIYHIEDEPGEVFAQINAQGLYPGMQVRVLEKSNTRIKFEYEGEECVLAPVLASNVHVIPLEDNEEITKDFENLSSISVGEEVVVVALSKALRGQQRRRMLDFGIVPGTLIKAQLKSLSGDPTAYEVRGTTIALRKNQSDKIYIKRKEKV